MTKLVVDASVAIKWFLPEPLSVEARRILDEYQAGRLSVLAPDLIHAEVGNIVWKRHMFQGLVAEDAETIVDEFRNLVITVTPTAELLEDAYRLAISHKRSVYDSMYVALAVREGCQFVTADEKLANAIGQALPSVIWLANWR